MEDIGIYLAKGIKTEIENFEEIQNFLRKIMENFIKESEIIYNKWKFFPFTNSEKQVLSALFPAIYKITENVWIEQWFKVVNENKNRFLDISIIDKTNAYFIEIKHGYKNHTGKVDITQNIYSKWNGAIKQIEDLEKENLGKEFDEVKLENFSCYKIALIIIPTFIKNPDEGSKAINDTAVSYAKRMFDYFLYDTSIEKKPNIAITWKINDYKKKEHEFKTVKKKNGEEERIEIYPFLTFVARVENMS
ncbi:hypothetical protein [Campylobacter rectus]|uniref:hypothetical protein n=1 Tax=Campylobacter rectus TaxID=203 RepID=UPI000F5EA3ED|nr:hypothetical protein [Campylobacter rectus]RRD52978.1 hypothetical protein EII16_09885 [Campylobacter rectus]